MRADLFEFQPKRLKRSLNCNVTYCFSIRGNCRARHKLLRRKQTTVAVSNTDGPFVPTIRFGEMQS